MTALPAYDLAVAGVNAAGGAMAATAAVLAPTGGHAVILGVSSVGLVVAAAARVRGHARARRGRVGGGGVAAPERDEDRARLLDELRRERFPVEGLGAELLAATPGDWRPSLVSGGAGGVEVAARRRELFAVTAEWERERRAAAL